MLNQIKQKTIFFYIQFTVSIFTLLAASHTPYKRIVLKICFRAHFLTLYELPLLHKMTELACNDIIFAAVTSPFIAHEATYSVQLPLKSSSKIGSCNS